MKSTWKKYLLYGSLTVVIFTLIIAGYSAAWTGFGNYTLPNSDFVRGKTLWDWLELLVIPLVLGIGAFFLNRSERNNEREIATDRQREAALQAYLDRMEDLLLKQQLRTSENEEVRNVARIRTLTVLRGLDARRKGFVIQFLSEAELIKDTNTIVSLEGADLRGADLRAENLKEANLSRAMLMNADLGYANLDRANLGVLLNGINLLGATLTDATLVGAFLNDANLELADLRGADLRSAVLTRATVKNANFSGANLRDAYVSDEQLATVRSLKEATLPDGSRHD